MKRVLVLVEGQTEERFLKEVLGPHLWHRGVIATPTIATTRRVKQGPDFKGGITSYQKVANDVRRLLGDSAASAITTLIDYYGLPDDFPGVSSRPPGTPLQRALHIENQWSGQVPDGRFRPYLMVHEFEALLFSRPEEIGAALHAPAVGIGLGQVRANFSTPEEINDSPDTCPSRRINQLSRAYQKVLHGPMIAQRIGLQTMREQCPHFRDWLGWLESL